MFSNGKPSSRIHGPLRACVYARIRPWEVSHYSSKRISVSSGKGLNFITNDLFLLLKYDGNYDGNK